MLKFTGRGKEIQAWYSLIVRTKLPSIWQAALPSRYVYKKPLKPSFKDCRPVLEDMKAVWNGIKAFEPSVILDPVFLKTLKVLWRNNLRLHI